MVAIAGLAAVLDVVVSPGDHEEQLGHTLATVLTCEVLILNVLPLPGQKKQY